LRNLELLKKSGFWKADQVRTGVIRGAVMVTSLTGDKHFPPYIEYVLVTGPADFEKRKKLHRKLDFFTREFWKVCVVTCGRREWIKKRSVYVGTDFMAQNWGLSNWYPVINFYADEHTLGSLAPIARNKEVVKFIKEKDGYAIVFWDGVCEETKDIIKRIKEEKIPIRLVRYT